MDRQGGDRTSRRGIGVRGSLDVDLYREVAREVAEDELRRAAATDVGDWFRFEIGGGTPMGDHAVRLRVNAVMVPRPGSSFTSTSSGRIVRMTGQPEDVPPWRAG